MCERNHSPRILAALFLVASTSSISIGATPSLAKDVTVHLEQGWSENDRSWWYGVSQGSRLIPLAWLQALEQPGSTTPFLDPENIAKLGYLTQGESQGLNLPVGFAIDQQDDSSLSVTRLRWRRPQSQSEPWVGLNCAACHTAEISYGSKRIRIEGAPASSDFQQMMAQLNAAVRETRSDPKKLSRFATSVLGKSFPDSDRALLENALDGYLEWQGRVDRQNETPLRYGASRLDAVGHILNKVALVLAPSKTQPWPADAPVSYPHIWNAPQHDKLQWNGIAANDPNPIDLGGQKTDLGALGRNAGEVVGVFGDISPDTFPWNGFRSSLQARNLIEIERTLGRLTSPKWPTEIFGKLDEARVQRGRKVFEERKCSECHKHLDSNDLTTRIEAKMSPIKDVGTDIWMACNTWAYAANSGPLEGVRDRIYKGTPLKATDSGSRLLTALITGALIGKADALLGSLAKDVFTSSSADQMTIASASTRFSPENGFPPDARKRALAERCTKGNDPLLAYKARPLNGIWATAPFLHNGSVPTLYDLLLPSDMRPLTALANAQIPQSKFYRPPTFWVGTREFDPDKVGFKTSPEAAGNSFKFDTRNAQGSELLGNSNAGHDYDNAAISNDDRWALVEYLKSL